MAKACCPTGLGAGAAGQTHGDGLSLRSIMADFRSKSAIALALTVLKLFPTNPLIWYETLRFGEAGTAGCPTTTGISNEMG